jgi:hypothetical protein
VTEDDSARLTAQLAEDLAAAHRTVRALDLENAEKALASRRLLAISDAAKHDVAAAARRLHRFIRDLDAVRNRLSGDRNDP